MRKLARSVAHYNMRRKGYVQINKQSKFGRSPFQMEWRDHIKEGK